MRPAAPATALLIHLALLLSPLGAAAEPGPTPRAVVIGVGQYLDPTIPPLEGPPHDAAEIRALLIERHGFDPAAVTLLVDAAATREAILRAIGRMAEQSRPGDPAVLYFSGHGARIFDASGDEPDGWDEGLVPYDSGRGDRPNRDLIDDEIYGLLGALTARGAAVTFIFDSCHSGTGARDAAIKVAPSDARADARLLTGLAPAVDGASGARGPPSDSLPAGWTLIAATREDQLAFEKPLGPDGARRGLLTWHLVRALREAEPERSLRDVFESVRAAVRQRDPRQDPQLEGPGADRGVFGVTPRPVEAYVLADPTEDGGAELQAGAAHGVEPGAVYAIRPPGAGRDAPGRRGTVTEVRASTARLTLDPGPPIAPASRAFLIAVGPQARAIPVYVDPTWGGGLALRNALRRFAATRLVEAPADARIRVTRVGPGLEVQGDDGRRLYAIPDAIPDAIPKASSDTGMPSDAMRMASVIQAWVRWYAIDELRSHDPELPVGLMAVADGVEHHHTAQVTAGDRFDLVVRNDGPLDLYLTLLALGPDGAVTVVYPLPGSRAYVQAFGRWRQPVEAALPEGATGPTTDRLKLVVTTAPADFRFLQQGAAGQGSGASKGLDPAAALPLAELWAAAGLGSGPPGATARGVAAGRWATRSLSITTAPADRSRRAPRRDSPRP